MTGPAQVWKSPDGKSTFRVHQTAGGIADGSTVLPSRVYKMALTVEAADGTSSEQWQWTPMNSGYGSLELAGVLVADSGKLFIVLGKNSGVIILDEKGRQHTVWDEAFRAEVLLAVGGHVTAPVPRVKPCDCLPRPAGRCGA
jgi:hypothetical protein